VGLILLAGGSCALNQVQEVPLDASMDRTKNRPLPSGKMSELSGLLVAFTGISFGLGILTFLSPLCAAIGFATVVLYNGFYTLIWKPKWIFAAVPGAIPGAMPILIGYSVNDANLLAPAAIYLFLIMFLWQMPHFWALAIKFKQDYSQGGVPTLPVALGEGRTVYHIGIYTIVYLGVAVASPWFVTANVFYILAVIPFSALLLFELIRFAKSDLNRTWFRFFMNVNVSLLIFLVAAFLDKWIHVNVPF
jgi:protoheme IX farnesyltransferase